MDDTFKVNKHGVSSDKGQIKEDTSEIADFQLEWLQT